MSNPPNQTEKFSLKAFQTRKTNLQSSGLKKTKAERKPTASNITRQLIQLGEDTMSHKATVANAAVAAILNIYKHNKSPDFYIQPGSNWKYEERFAVLWSQPPHVQITPTKEELRAALVNFDPKTLDLISLGYSIIYQYIPRPTAPDKLVYLLMSQHLTKEHFQYLMRMKGKVRVPPQLPNMLSKLRINLSQDLKEPPKQVLDHIVKISSCHAPHVIAQFTEALINKKTCVQAMMDFVYEAQPHPASPGFPWTSMFKTDGTAWGQLSVSNEPLFKAILETIERLIKFLNGAIGTTEETRDKMSRKQAFERGHRLYDKLFLKNYKGFVIDKILTEQKLTESDVNYLSPHIIFTQSAGNVKPVTSEEIGEGKPDRSIFQSPGMIRIAYMYLSSVVSDCWKNPSKMSNFGWAKGGSELLVSRLFEQVGLKENEFIEQLDYLEQQEGMNVHDITFPRACFITPDIKAQDNHFHSEVFRVLYDVLERDIVSKLPKYYQNVFMAYLGFMHACEQKPIIMTNNSTIYSPKHLNPSGGPFTSAHSNNHSNIIKVEADSYDWGSGMKIAHLANGDDAIIMLYNSQKSLPAIGYHGVRDIHRTADSKLNNTRLQENQHVQKRCLDIQHGVLKKFAAHIRKKYSIELKPETLVVYPTLSSCEFLGNHIYYLDDKQFGTHALVSCRLLEKVTFSMLWGQTQPSSGFSPHMIAAMRVLSAYYDVSLVYGKIHIGLAKIYSALRKLEANKPMPSRKYFESDFMELPDDIGQTLPDLPILSEVFTWMTGILVSEHKSSDTVEGEEFLSYEEDYEAFKGKEVITRTLADNSFNSSESEEYQEYEEQLKPQTTEHHESLHGAKMTPGDMTAMKEALNWK